MSTVQIVVNSKSNSLITNYKSNPEYGYIQLQQTAISIGADGWIREQKRACILRATTEILKTFVSAHKSLQVPGKIVTREYLESQLPENIAAQLNKNVDYETSISSYIKRAGADGDELTLGGERILRFSTYDATGNEQDVLIAHDNVVVKSNATVKSTATAEL